MSNIENKTIQDSVEIPEEEINDTEEKEVDLSDLCCGGDCNNGCDRYDIDRDNELAFS
jgi:hypothetical protein